MVMNKLLGAAALAAIGGFGVDAAEAREVDVQWSVTIGSPYYALPAPAVVYPPIYRAPVAGYYGGHRGYQTPRYWDRDGDGIPNRFDHRYNPRWDRDGDGIPNRYDRHPNGGWNQGGHGWQGGRGGHDGRGDGGGGHRGRDGYGGRGH
jgi:hypothetical protein